MRGREFRSALAALVVFSALIALSSSRLSARLTHPYPALTELVYNQNYPGDLGALMLGSRRSAGNVAYIQFLQYYGTRENARPGAKDNHAHHEGHSHAEAFSPSDGTTYPYLWEHATRILRLDPYFHGAMLEAAGALAFNERRIGQSLELLKEAIRRDPTFYRYHLYATAILYREKGDDTALIDQLLQAIQTPDCPPLLESVLGNLLRKNNRPREAAAVYLHTYETAARASDRETAYIRLRELFKAHPELSESKESL